MLDGEGQAVLGAAEIEVTVPPCVELGGAAKCLSGACGCGFAGMVDENVDGRLKARISGEERASGPNIFTGCTAEKLPVERPLA